MTSEIDAEKDDGDGDPDVAQTVACAGKPRVVGPLEIAETDETVELPGSEGSDASGETYSNMIAIPNETRTGRDTARRHSLANGERHATLLDHDDRSRLTDSQSNVQSGPDPLDLSPPMNDEPEQETPGTLYPCHGEHRRPWMVEQGGQSKPDEYPKEGEEGE